MCSAATATIPGAHQLHCTHWRRLLEIVADIIQRFGEISSTVITAALSRLRGDPLRRYQAPRIHRTIHA